MGVNVEADGLEHIDETIRLMINDIDQLGKYNLVEEMVAWQSDDMNRQYPNVVIENDKTVMTRVWPRSRTWVPKPKAGSRTVQRVYAPPRRSTRPILRAELFTMLCERMFRNMTELLKWDV
jgi:hypothetical protein